MKPLINFIFLFSLVLFSCSKEQQVKFEPYTGPVIEAFDIHTAFSDSARPKILLTSPHELEFENGDQEFPEGIYMEFFDDKTFKKSSTLKGSHARYFKEKDIYIVTGDVIVQSITENKKLNSEELIWNPTEKQITSDKFVRIETPCEILTGTGLISNEDFTNYKILKPKATIFTDCE